MNKEEYRQELSNITTILLDESSYPGQLLESCNEMHGLLSGISGVGGEDYEVSTDKEDLMLSSGKAISTWSAGRCIIEFSRTAKYLRGLHDAISDMLKSEKERPLRILYAGCGPYATLALPLMEKFSPDQLQFTLLEINEVSLESAKTLIKSFEYDDFVSDYHLCDATSYHHPTGRPFHIIITETMLRALEIEPQAAITLNLADQLCEGGIFIPQRIVIDTALVDMAKEFTFYPAGSEIPQEDIDNPGRNRRRQFLGRLLDFTASSALEIREKVTSDSSGQPHFPPITLKIPSHIEPGLDMLLLLTNIEIYGHHFMGDYESSITNSLQLTERKKVESWSEIEFTYVIGKKPGFQQCIVKENNCDH